MTHSMPGPHADSSDDSAAIRNAVHAAFDHVALSLSCTIPMLIEETRRRGIADEDVRRILEEDEAEANEGIESDMHLLCYRSNAGVPYVTRDTAAGNERLATPPILNHC